jgi:hypothetical protein
VYPATNHINPASRPAAIHFSNVLIFTPSCVYGIPVRIIFVLCIHDGDSLKGYEIELAIMKNPYGTEQDISS